jgi:hypothetical protein
LTHRSVRRGFLPNAFRSQRPDRRDEELRQRASLRFAGDFAAALSLTQRLGENGINLRLTVFKERRLAGSISFPFNQAATDFAPLARTPLTMLVLVIGGEKSPGEVLGA